MAKIKMPITAEQWRELDTKTKRANQRLASAFEGQRAALERFVPDGKFSREKPTSVAEYNQRMRDVERFLASEQSKRSGWKAIKKRAVEAAGETLRDRRKYDLTDDELANIFKEIEKKSAKNFYKVLDLIQAKKYDADAKDADFDLQQAINQAVRSHMSAGEAIARKERARERAVKASDLRK